ncbi:(deoxy)nucleoside triphosphate pyrophosphohydrolase [Globicatella sulfidifaciens]|uniref:8-oxo-dGTP diphosphatase n=1 Tax=Globicatella sulfidifaciens TaxID=136093 RepID=A0A7X8C230_9LACT|nr:(deoxy)nucleoside triphosphate pyrophosphohydrolase [Globicatella sulfidifaciens]NLJ17570.1 (deoxy)nucleoside triphosphate pyrophosphohydrolase [Globicatella sulfidifaciens]
MKKIEVSAALIVNEEKEILCTKRLGGEFDGMWEFPGGKIEDGEDGRAAVIREIKEELSVDIAVDEYFTTITYQYASFHLTMHLYFSSIINGELILNEHSDATWSSVDKMDNLNWVPADVQIIELLKDSSYLQ